MIKELGTTYGLTFSFMDLEQGRALAFRWGDEYFWDPCDEARAKSIYEQVNGEGSWVSWESDAQQTIEDCNSDYLPEMFLGSLSGTTKFVWGCRGGLFAMDRDLDQDDVEALIDAHLLDREDARRRVIERAKSRVAMSSDIDDMEAVDGSDRRAIPDKVKTAVWQRDGGKCMKCGTNRELEFDHIIPRAMGGADSFRNLQLLCGPCNRQKGANLI